MKHKNLQEGAKLAHSWLLAFPDCSKLTQEAFRSYLGAMVALQRGGAEEVNKFWRGRGHFQKKGGDSRRLHHSLLISFLLNEGASDPHGHKDDSENKNNKQAIFSKLLGLVDLEEKITPDWMAFRAGEFFGSAHFYHDKRVNKFDNLMLSMLNMNIDDRIVFFKKTEHYWGQMLHSLDPNMRDTLGKNLTASVIELGSFELAEMMVARGGNPYFSKNFSFHPVPAYYSASEQVTLGCLLPKLKTLEEQAKLVKLQKDETGGPRHQKNTNPPPRTWKL